MDLKGILSKKQLEMVERDTYNRSEYNHDYKNEWCKGNDLIGELISEYDALENGYYIEKYIED